MEKQEEGGPEQEETLATPGVIDKYQIAGKIANTVLENLIKKCVPGARLYEICLAADNEIDAELAKVYNKKKIEKGLAFPTCISLNEICGHFSPLKDDQTVLKAGDLAKIELGVQIDGYIGLVGHSLVIGGEAAATERKADALLAAYHSLQAALRLLKPGNKNTQVTEAITKICGEYKVNAVEGVLSHEVKKHLIDGNNCIINKETFDQRVEEIEFQVNQVYALDIIVSTGEGKPKEADLRPTVFKRALDRNYTLKTKHGRTFFNELTEKFPTLLFSLRSFADENAAKLGVADCLKHDLLTSYPILTEKADDAVAQFTATVMILKGGTLAITGLPVEDTKFKTANKIADKGILDILATSMDRKDQKAQRKTKEKAAGKPEEAKKE